ncbi:MAG: flavoprotein [Patescibacteria group bacterium]
MKILLGVTGSVAAKLTSELADKLVNNGLTVRIVATEKSLYFWNSNNIHHLVYRDCDEWKNKMHEKGSPVLHIQLRDWADLFLIAPLSANSLAKIANGFADNLLTCVARAWDRQKPIVLAPAMNTYMWEHPATSKQLKQIQRWFPKSLVVGPIKKKLACGTVGVGAMAKIETIVKKVKKIGEVCAQ